MSKYSVSSVAQFIELIEEINVKQILWFRGIPDVSYKPVPGIIWKKLLKHESAMEHDFLIAYKSYVERPDLNSWDIYSMMQHHGLPTRLLDWSESPLVALYFALTSEPTKEGSRGVWVLNPSSLNTLSTTRGELYCPAAIVAKKFTVGDGNTVSFDAYLPPNLTPSDDDLTYPTYPLAIYASKQAKRIANQRGCFTVHGSDKRSINEFLDEESCYLVEIKLPSETDRLRMISTLDSMGVDEEFIYQDLDSLCERIQRRWKK
ncbi:TPA: FRG domain-containing protein [Vibrio vulnificus]|nr:FRG domain-containing protein [Vibrio vulnificus]